MSVGTVWWANYLTGQTVELPLDSLWKKTPIFTSENLVFSGDFPVTVHLESTQKMWGTVKTSDEVISEEEDDDPATLPTIKGDVEEMDILLPSTYPGVLPTEFNGAREKGDPPESGAG
ncbi:hypothetical protein BYT27DRAFT_7282722 [Phlegmacium glaucopus]|nr:hypothetical protein BYT27DRAFT_7282722 [Phlegmacium glaucopus]